VEEYVGILAAVFSLKSGSVLMNDAHSVKGALVDFHQKYFDRYKAENQFSPTVEHDSDWPSPCELGTASEGQSVQWQPIACQSILNFDNIESALEMTLHPDLKAYFSSFYCSNLPARTEDGGLELLFAWSQLDFERLQENLLGHIWMKRKLRDTFFCGD
jgi:SecY interacting protein Syd